MRGPALRRNRSAPKPGEIGDDATLEVPGELVCNQGSCVRLGGEGAGEAARKDRADVTLIFGYTEGGDRAIRLGKTVAPA